MYKSSPQSGFECDLYSSGKRTRIQILQFFMFLDPRVLDARFFCCWSSAFSFSVFSDCFSRLLLRFLCDNTHLANETNFSHLTGKMMSKGWIRIWGDAKQRQGKIPWRWQSASGGEGCVWYCGTGRSVLTPHLSHLMSTPPPFTPLQHQFSRTRPVLWLLIFNYFCVWKLRHPKVMFLLVFLLVLLAWHELGFETQLKSRVFGAGVREDLTCATYYLIVCWLRDRKSERE